MKEQIVTIEVAETAWIIREKVKFPKVIIRWPDVVRYLESILTNKDLK